MPPKFFSKADSFLDIIKAPINKETYDRTIRIVDLFCGAGGMTAGAVLAESAVKANIEVAFAADNNEDARKAYRKNFSRILENFSNHDLSRFLLPLGNQLSAEEEEFKTMVGNTDILFAGPPCQGHSDLNNSTRRLDPRNELYFVVPRAIEILKPQFAIIENVPGVVHSKEQVVQKTREHLESIDYKTQEISVDFDRLGIAQKRKRHILFVTKGNLFPSSFFETNRQSTNLVSDWLKDIPHLGNPLLHKTTSISEENEKRINFLFENNLYDLPNSLRPACHRDKAHSYNSVYGRLYPDKPAQTLTSGFGSMGQGRYIHPTEKRTITAREAMRIQCFPDWYDFEGINKITSIRKLIANAVPAVLTYHIISQLYK